MRIPKGHGLDLLLFITPSGAGQDSACDQCRDYVPIPVNQQEMCVKLFAVKARRKSSWPFETNIAFFSDTRR